MGVLLATRNGARFLEEQLASIAAQTVERLDLLVSDDGSSDDTLPMIRRWGGEWDRGAFALLDGPRTGEPADNFRSLLARLADDYDYAAFSDQDDVWLPDKLSRAIAALGDVEPGVPALYCARTALIDERGRPIGFSPAFERPPSFRNALVQSLAGGNTMLLNRAALHLMRESSRRTRYPAHDWWSYILVTGAGGRVVYSSTPGVLYRQHDRNAVGSNLGWLARANRFWHLAHGRFRRWNDENLAALALCEDMLTDDARQVMASFIAARTGTLGSRLGRLREAGVYRQTRAANAMLLVATAMGWT